MDRTTEMLSAFTCGLTFEELGPTVVEQVKRTLIDTMGCAIGGYDSEPATIARSLAEVSSGSMASRVLGTQLYAAPDMAAFANGVAVRYLDCNDSYFSPGGGHPSDMIPAVLALADPLKSDGPTLIASIALAYEVFCRLSDEVVASELGWDQGIFSVVGAVCGAARVMGLNQEQTGNAIALSVAPNLPLAVTRTGELSMWKGCATASASRSAVFAALLASKGMTGPSEPFEGRYGLWGQAVGRKVDFADFPSGGQRGDDDPFRITRTIFKAFPSQIHTQAPIGLALELRDKMPLGDISDIYIETYKIAASTASSEPEKWDPKTRETADHSIPWLVASALLYGPVAPDGFSDDRIADPALRDIMARMSLAEQAEFTAKYPAEYNCRITLTGHDGRSHTAYTSWPKGHRSNPMSDSEVESKFHNFSEPLLTEQQRSQALEVIWRLDTLSTLDPLYDSLTITR